MDQAPTFVLGPSCQGWLWLVPGASRGCPSASRQTPAPGAAPGTVPVPVRPQAETRTPRCFLTELVFVRCTSPNHHSEECSPHTTICHCQPGEQLYSIQPEINRRRPTGRRAGTLSLMHQFGAVECLWYALPSLALPRKSEGIWGKAILLHARVVKLQIKRPSRNTRDRNVSLDSSGSSAFWIGNEYGLVWVRSWCLGRPGTAFRQHCLTAVPGGRGPVTFQPVKRQ